MSQINDEEVVEMEQVLDINANVIQGSDEEGPVRVRAQPCFWFWYYFAVSLWIILVIAFIVNEVIKHELFLYYKGKIVRGNVGNARNHHLITLYE